MVRLVSSVERHPRFMENIHLSKLLVWVIIDELQFQKEMTFMDILILSERYTNYHIPTYLALDWLLSNGVIRSQLASLPISYSLV